MFGKFAVLSFLTTITLLPIQNAVADQIIGYFWIENGCWARHPDGTFTSAPARSCPTKVTQKTKDAAFGPIDETGELVFLGIVLPVVANGPILDHKAKRVDYSRPIKEDREVHFDRLLPPLLREQQQ